MSEWHSAYLSAMVDGEGHVTFNRNAHRLTGARRMVRHVGITNTDPGILSATCDALDHFGVRYGIFEKTRPNSNHARCWVIAIQSREGFERLAQVVHLRCEKKRRALLEICRSFRPRRPTPAVLKALRDDGLRTGQIAQRLGCSRSAVVTWERKDRMGRIDDEVMCHA